MDLFILISVCIIGVLIIAALTFIGIAIKTGTFTPEKREVVKEDIEEALKTAIKALEDGKITREEMESFIELAMKFLSDVTKEDVNVIKKRYNVKSDYSHITIN